jgi:hypothetical protein
MGSLETTRLQMSDHPDKLITNPAVARLFSVAPRTIFNWVVRPELGFPRPLIISIEAKLSLIDRNASEVEVV